jgi:hypothetical protein
MKAEFRRSSAYMSIMKVTASAPNTVSMPQVSGRPFARTKAGNTPPKVASRSSPEPGARRRSARHRRALAIRELGASDLERRLVASGSLQPTNTCR